jgi:hypothetical protein
MLEGEGAGELILEPRRQNELWPTSATKSNGRGGELRRLQAAIGVVMLVRCAV